MDARKDEPVGEVSVVGDQRGFPDGCVWNHEGGRCVDELRLTAGATASFVGPRQDKTGRRFPQAIAHRGYKAAYPENTMSAFVGAVAARAHAIETDVHLSKDNVVVLSHVGGQISLIDEVPQLLTPTPGRYAQTMFRKAREDHRL